MATAAGIPCDVDPLLFNAMKIHCSKINITVSVMDILFCRQEYR